MHGHLNLPASAIAERATNWPPKGYWDTGAKIVTMTMANRFVIRQPAQKNFVLMGYDHDTNLIQFIDYFDTKYDAKQRMQDLWRKEHDEEE
jgi:hypothetical protein